jgi:hypothetical protein
MEEIPQSHGPAIVVPGALGDLSPGSFALGRIASSGPHPLPTALIAGTALGQNLAGLDVKGSNANRLHNYCSSDPLAQKLTSMGWPTVFTQFNGEASSDAVVGLGSQLNLPPNPSSASGFQFTGYIHSRGLLDLSFAGPSVVDPDIVPPQGVSIPKQVINLLNTPVTQPSFNFMNP